LLFRSSKSLNIKDDFFRRTLYINDTPMTEPRDVTCHMGSHSVTCYPTQVNAPRLNPSLQAGTRFTLPSREGWKAELTSWWLVTYRDGVPVPVRCPQTVTHPSINRAYGLLIAANVLPLSQTATCCRLRSIKSNYRNRQTIRRNYFQSRLCCKCDDKLYCLQTGRLTRSNSYETSHSRFITAEKL